MNPWIVAGLRPGPTPLTPAIHTDPVRLGPICMEVATCTLPCARCHFHTLTEGPPGGGWGGWEDGAGCWRVGPTRRRNRPSCRLESPVSSQYPEFMCVQVRVGDPAILPSQRPTEGALCADAMAPSATSQVRKCPSRAAADHRSHGERVIALGRPVEVHVHHSDRTLRRVRNWPEWRTRGLQRGFDQIPIFASLVRRLTIETAFSIESHGGEMRSR
jgi:hypothetical protein